MLFRGGWLSNTSLFYIASTVILDDFTIKRLHIHFRKFKITLLILTYTTKMILTPWMLILQLNERYNFLFVHFGIQHFVAEYQVSGLLNTKSISQLVVNEAEGAENSLDGGTRWLAVDAFTRQSVAVGSRCFHKAVCCCWQWSPVDAFRRQSETVVGLSCCWPYVLVAYQCIGT